jgi:CTP synthase (UTP-ammonia lyase)
MMTIRIALIGDFDSDKIPHRAIPVAIADEVRGVELADHPFFVATLFQPERSALRRITPPLVKAFVRAAAIHALQTT